MAKRIGRRDVRALEPNQSIWDSAVPGFHARRQRSTAVSYVLFYRTAEGRQRFYTIGRHGAPWTPETAREEARRLLGEVAQKRDPAASSAGCTVAELCDRYISDAESGRLMTRLRRAKKPSTLVTDRGRVERHIKPLLGRRSVVEVTSNDIERFMHDVANGKTKANIKTKEGRAIIVEGGMGTASRTVGLLGGIFTYAVRQKLRPDNPVRGVVRPADGRRTRRLSDAEYAALGAALRTDAWPPSVAAVRFLALTGWRSGEALGLTWREVDLERRTCRLGDTKTGESLRPLSEAACAVLADMKVLGLSGELAFPPTRGYRLELGGFWTSLGLPKDVTPHVLRHSFASLAADLGLSEPTIAALIGHKRWTVTSRYMHSADAVLLAAADRVAGETLKRMCAAG
ncbi:tyrosine-type recombinase/integrase [Nordella sp. HKS 07]|uniref:tyrosine-type recombinase/integrase n=1 Tax=Nordella sp. HKS 07 TaxID=2712222 RepID=UPI0013E0F230|nr:site-specific integrase [Nordella sp. HKS 07]QIG47940.1 tyrosine-type recombinase/integrase [Nordella sp. HKS 07]